MIIHYHHAIVPNSGFLKRMKNIDQDVVGVLGEKSIEVEFYPKSKKEYVMSDGQFNLSSNVARKYYVGLTSNSKKDFVIRLFTFAKLLLRYRPSYIIGEASMQPKLIRYFRFLSPKTKVVFDIHGAVAEEVAYQGYSEREVEINKKVERDSVQRVDYVICQSDEMKRYMQKEYQISANKVCVYRCGVDTSLFHIDNDLRYKKRRELGISDDELLFVYSGSMHAWQRIEDSIKIFTEYHSHNPKSKMLVLTAELDTLHEIITKNNWDDGSIISKCVPFAEVSAFLNACDVAFLLRHNHTMNAVASPTKLAEYMACGLPVITSEVAKKWVNEDGYRYFFIEGMKTRDALTNFIQMQDKGEISNYASKYLSLDVDKESVWAFFSKKYKE